VLAWVLGYFRATSALPQKPRRRAGESLERFRAASVAAAEPMGHAPTEPSPAPAEPSPAPVVSPPAHETTVQE